MTSSKLSDAQSVLQTEDPIIVRGGTHPPFIGGIAGSTTESAEIHLGKNTNWKVTPQADGSTLITVPPDARWQVTDGAQGVIVERPGVNFDDLDIDGYIERTLHVPAKQKPDPNQTHDKRKLNIKLKPA